MKDVLTAVKVGVALYHLIGLARFPLIQLSSELHFFNMNSDVLTGEQGATPLRVKYEGHQNGSFNHMPLLKCLSNNILSFSEDSSLNLICFSAIHKQVRGDDVKKTT